MLLCFQTKGEHPYFRNFNINNGLVSNKIYCITEDRYGFIWIGTDQGVSRFDGVQFTNFTSANGLPVNEILGIFEDSKGRIWFNSFSAEPAYYLNGKIYNAHNEPFLKRVLDHKTEERNYSFIVQNNNSIAFLVAEKEKRWIIGKDIRDIEVKYTTELRSPIYQNILIEHQQTYHVISQLEIVSWKKNDSLKLSDFRIWGTNFRYSSAPKGPYIYGLKKESSNNLVYQFDLINERRWFYKVDQKYNNVYDFDGKKFLTGTQTYALMNDSFNRPLEQAELPFIFDFMYYDAKGNKWFGTSDNGIYVINNFSPNKVDMDPAYEKGILSLETGVNALFVRTENKGLLELNSKGEIQVKFFDPNHMRIRGFYQNESFVIVGTDGGFSLMDKQFRHPVLLSKQAVKDIEPGLKDEVLVGAAKHTFIYRHDSLIDVNEKRTYAVCRLDARSLLSGGLDGIYINTESDAGFSTSKYKIDSLLDNTGIIDLKLDNKQNLWIATDQYGLFFHSKKYGLKRFSQNKDRRFNLLSDICSRITIDENNAVWIATQSGISKITYTEGASINDFKVMNYSLSEGIPGKIVSSVALFKDRFYLSCPDGIFYYPKIPNPINVSSSTLINSVWVNSRTYNADTISLPYDENSLLINYASSFINMGNTYRFIYRIKELKNQWTETQNLQIPLLGLNPGKYTFEIASVNTQGEHGAIKTLNIYIQTPWFKQIWFISLILLTLGLSIAYYFKLYKDKMNLGTKLTLMKLRVLRAQMNPHFVFNALSNIQQLINLNQLESAKQYIGTLSIIMRKSLDYSVKEFIRLDKELEYTESYLKIEKLRFSDKFDYIIHSNLPAEEMYNYYVPPLLLQPIVENCIKHAFKSMQVKGLIEIGIERLEGKKLRYTVKDNGKGFDISKIRTNEFGLGIAEERVKLLYKDMKNEASFKLESSEKTGTTITIELPALMEEI